MPSAQKRTHASLMSMHMATFCSGGKRPSRSQSLFTQLYPYKISWFRLKKIPIARRKTLALEVGLAAEKAASCLSLFSERNHNYANCQRGDNHDQRGYYCVEFCHGYALGVGLFC